MQIPDNPFHIVAFAPFLVSEAVEKRGTISPMSIQSANQGLVELRPTLYIPLPKALSPEGGITLEFSALSDFEPDEIVSRTPWLRALRDSKDAVVAPTGPESSLDSIFSMVELPGVSAPDHKQPAAEANEADSILSGVLTRICGDDDFRRMAAAWQGVALLFEKGADRLRLDIVPVSKDTAVDALESTASFLDNTPPDLILLDAPFDSTPVGIRLLEAASDLAERLMSPVICWCGPGFLHLDDWAGLNNLPYLPNQVSGFSYAGWKALQDRPAAFWTIASCNRFLVTRDNDEPVGRTSPNYLAPVWAIAALILQTFAGKGTPLPLSRQTLQFRDSSGVPFAHLETSISDDRSHQMVECGLLPLMHVSGGNGIRLPSAVTINYELIVSPLTLSTVIHTLICLRETYGPSDNPESLAADLREAFMIHPRLKGSIPEGAIEFRGSELDGDGRVRIEVTVNGRRFGAKIIDFTFDW